MQANKIIYNTSIMLLFACFVGLIFFDIYLFIYRPLTPVPEQGLSVRYGIRGTYVYISAFDKGIHQAFLWGTYISISSVAIFKSLKQ